MASLCVLGHSEPSLQYWVDLVRPLLIEWSHNGICINYLFFYSVCYICLRSFDLCSHSHFTESDSSSVYCVEQYSMQRFISCLCSYFSCSVLRQMVIYGMQRFHGIVEALVRLTQSVVMHATPPPSLMLHPHVFPLHAAICQHHYGTAAAPGPAQ